MQGLVGQRPGLSWVPRSMDLGLPLKANGDCADSAELSNLIGAWLSGWDAATAAECAALDTRPDWILTDISPLGCLVGTRLGVPVVGVSNFTWYDQYTGRVSEPLIHPLKVAYASLAAFLCYPLSMPMAWLPCPRIPLGVVGRRATSAHVAQIRGSSGRRWRVTISFGKAFAPIARLDLRNWGSNVTFFVDDSVRIDALGEVVRLNNSFALHEYIAASDVVVTKGGWGAVSESLFHNIPLLLVDRDVNEDRHNIRQVEALGKGQKIDWAELSAFSEGALYKLIKSYNAAPYKPHGYSVREAFALTMP